VQNIELQNWVGNIQYATSHQHIISFTSSPFREHKFLETNDDYCMHISLTILGSIARTITCGQEKFTQLGQWESLFAQGDNYRITWHTQKPLHLQGAKGNL
jgi:hypothetical protein